MRNWVARARSVLRASTIAALAGTARSPAALAKITRNAWSLYALGQSQVASGQLEAAIATFRAILAADATYVRARVALATVLSARGDTAAALAEIDTVLRQDPRHRLARNVKGHVEAASGHLDAAIDTFRRIVADDPKGIDGRIALANVLSEKGDRSQAIAELDAVLQRDPNHVGALRTKGQIEAAAGRTAGAIRSLERCLVLAPADAETWLALGDCHRVHASDGFIKAEQCYRNALSRSPPAFAAYRGLGECLARHKRLDEAQAAHDAWFQHWIADAQSAVLRRRQEDAQRRGVPAIMFVAMLKSASEFIRENLIRALDIPLIDVNIGTVPRDRLLPSAVRQLAKGGAISRVHMSGDNLPGLATNGLQQVIVHARDPRQVTISWVHMMRRLSDAEFCYAAYMYDPPLPDAFRAWTLERQLNWAVENFLPGQLDWLEGWVSALASAPPIRVKVSRFEDFRKDQDAFFREILDFCGIDRAHLPQFEEQSQEAMRNFRNGAIAEWRAVLTDEQLSPLKPRLKVLAEHFGWED